ncbi:MAG: pyruvate:ferredoxin (flavodoxin) oxidoreductase [Planctomycetes bacterium]|nr:pyruvate:ferredoxin (flavodoxin) oxidoreductase [Planctomycetota bacterium]
MVTARTTTIDGNEAAGSVAYRLSEVAAIYPITPSSPMGELADEWAARDRPNVFGTVPTIVEMQSEGGAAGAVHGALQAGALAVTFTASQGLLLMIPTMYKIAGELLPFVMHVAARTVATHALSIFGDHSDVMAVRQTGFAMLCSASVQEAQDLACIAHMATLHCRVPFVHFFDGFRTSHEVATIQALDDDDLRALIDVDAIAACRRHALTPDRPVLRGTAQNPDAFFQAREACTPFYADCERAVDAACERFAARTGRRYLPFEYHGHPAAERVIVVMGSATATVRRAVEHLSARGEAVGLLQVRLFRPFAAARLLAALPATVRAIAVLDRTKEPGAPAEPLCLDVIAALRQAEQAGRARQAVPPLVIGGRYGLSGKEFTPAMALAVFAELTRPAPRMSFTIGIVDDVSGSSLLWERELDLPLPGAIEAVFFGLGADGTVGANKSSIKIIGEYTDHHAQGYFVYDSKKSGAITISHLRFSPQVFEAPYLIRKAGFVACHQFGFLDRYDVLGYAAPGATLLLAAPCARERVWDELPAEVQQQILDLRLRVFAIDAEAVAKAAGVGGRINTIMQVCFFALAEVLPREQAIGKIKDSIRKSYDKKGDEIVRRNFAAVDAALAHLHEVPVPAVATATRRRPPTVAAAAPDFVQRVTAVLLAGKGDELPVSAFPPDGTWPTDTARWEKRGIAAAIPVWDSAICIQCNKCALMCPHAAIRAKVWDPAIAAPDGFPAHEWRGKEFPGQRYTIQVAPDDCTGCGLCVQVCPAKDKGNPRHKAIDMTPVREVRERERARYEFFLALPEIDRASIQKLDVRGSQLLQPLFEYSGACAGCGETPYLKLLTQLFGDRAIIANATGCSSIYGGNLPTTPYAVDALGRGPAWANSLFEDNAEFGLGIRLAVEVLTERARGLLHGLGGMLGADELIGGLLATDDHSEAFLQAQRARVVELRRRLGGVDGPQALELAELADYLVRKSIWLVGGDGWAFDIGYGGLDHVLSMHHDVNVLVLDTEVYSNTGGQASKATPLGAAAKFATRGKAIDKKDLGLMAVNYGHVFVASVAVGAQDAHTVRVFREAEAYRGPSLIIAYSPCIAHGYDLVFGADQQKRAVQAGVWPLFRYDPQQAGLGQPPLVVDSPGGSIPVAEYMRNEARFKMVEKIDPAGFKRYANGAQQAAARRMAVYQHIAQLRFPSVAAAPAGAAEAAAPDQGTRS